MATRYQHVLDTIRRDVANQVGGLLWDDPEEGMADDGDDDNGDDRAAGGNTTDLSSAGSTNAVTWHFAWFG